MFKIQSLEKKTIKSHDLMCMSYIKIYFIPIVDEESGELVYSFELFKEVRVIDALVIVMPNEFSIQLDFEPETVHPSKIVKMTLYDILQTFPVLTKAKRIIIYHEGELDRAGMELGGVINALWGQYSSPDNSDHVMDSIYISREFYNWLKFFAAELQDKDLLDSLSKYHQREGLVDFDLDDDLHDIIVQRIIEERRLILKNRRRIRKSMAKVSIPLEKAFEKKALKKWDRLFKDGIILYYKPGEKPIL